MEENGLRHNVLPSSPDKVKPSPSLYTYPLFAEESSPPNKPLHLDTHLQSSPQNLLRKYKSDSPPGGHYRKTARHHQQHAMSPFKSYQQQGQTIAHGSRSPKNKIKTKENPYLQPKLPKTISIVRCRHCGGIIHSGSCMRCSNVERGRMQFYGMSHYKYYPPQDNARRSPKKLQKERSRELAASGLRQEYSSRYCYTSQSPGQRIYSYLKR